MSSIIIITQDDEGPLEKLAEQAGELKKGIDDIGKGREALEAIQAAIDYAASDEPDMVDALALFGKALGLAKEFAPPGMDSFIETYASAIDAIAGALQDIPLTAADRAADRAYDETGDPDKAVAAARKIIEAPAEDWKRALKRLRLKHLKKVHVPKKAEHWYDWKYLPWNWFSSLPGPRWAEGLAALALLGGAYLALHSLGGSQPAGLTAPGGDHAALLLLVAPRAIETGTADIQPVFGDSFFDVFVAIPAVEPASEPPASRPVLLPVEDVFTIEGRGTVVVHGSEGAGLDPVPVEPELVALHIADATPRPCGEGDCRAFSTPLPANAPAEWIALSDGVARVRDNDGDGNLDEVHVDTNRDGVIDAGEPHYSGASGIQVIPWSEKNPECWVYVDTDGDGFVETRVRAWFEGGKIKVVVENFPFQAPAPAPEKPVEGGCERGVACGPLPANPGGCFGPNPCGGAPAGDPACEGGSCGGADGAEAPACAGATCGEPADAPRGCGGGTCPRPEPETPLPVPAPRTEDAPKPSQPAPGEGTGDTRDAKSGAEGPKAR